MDFTEQTTKRNTIYQGRIINVRSDEALLPDGRPCLREVVEHPGGVCVAALTAERELLFVRQFRYPYGETLLELPAGKLDWKEDPLEAGKRELREETGAVAERYHHLGKFYPTPGYCDEVIHLYWATHLTFVQPEPDEDEYLELVRIPLEKAVEMVLNNTLRDGKTQAAVLKVAALLQKEPSLLQSEPAPLLLASASPRRAALLRQAGLHFHIEAVQADETIPAGTAPEEGVQLLARRKAAAAGKVHPQSLILGADTIVVFDEHLLGKPRDEADALRMLTALAGKTHQVYTGVCLWQGEREHCFYACTDVTFYPAPKEQLLAYIKTGEPMDKAGAYGIQGKGAALVQKIHGDYNNVVGLPLAMTLQAIAAFTQ